MADYNTTWLFIGIGQRYDVVFTANQTSDRYWFRVEVPSNNCANNALSNPTTGIHRVFAIFSYKDATSAPEPVPSNSTVPYLHQCVDEAGMAPWLNKSIDPNEFNFVTGTSDELVLTGGTRPLPAPDNINHWLINE